MGSAIVFPVRLRFTSLVLLALAAGAQADIGWSVNIVDPTDEYASFHSTITQNLLAAGNAWGSRLVGSGTIDVNISFADIPTADASATDWVLNHTTPGGVDVYEWGTTSEIRTGVDPNGAEADIDIRLGRDWMNNVFFWDPNPTQRTAAIPQSRIDGQSTLMHEIGHGLAFNGWLNGTNVSNQGYESMYDEQISLVGGNLYFNGANAMAAYGGPVPLTYGNYAHYGNAAPRPGSELVGTRLMNGVFSYYQTRWYVTDLDLGFLADTGYTLKAAPVPEPATMAALGLGVAATLRRRKRR